MDALARDLPVPDPAEGFDAFPARVRARIAARPRRGVVLPVWGWAVAATLLLAVVTPLTLVTLQRPREAPATVPAVSAPAATTLAPLESMKEARAEVVTRDARTSESQPKATANDAKVLAWRRDAPPLKDAPSSSSTTGTVGGVLGGTGGAEQDRLARPQAPAPGGKTAYVQATPAPEAMAEAVTATPAPEKKRQAGAGDRAGFSAPAAAPAAPAAPEAPPPAQEAKQAADKLAKREKGVIVREEVTVAGEDTASDYAAKPAPSPERTLNGRLEGRGDLSLAKPPFASVAAARQARDAWRAYVGTLPLGPRADEARVRIIEAGLAAWELSREEPDRTVLRRDIAEYLARRDAAQAERVRALRRRLEPR